jgi:hypothetical protein
MSEDLIKQIQDLISSGKGEEGRLKQILEILQSGNRLDSSDQKYLDSLTLTNTEPIDVGIPELVDSPSSSTSPTVDNSQNKSETSLQTRTKSKRIAIAAIVVAVVLAAYLGLDVYAVNALQFRPHSGTQTVISDTELGVQADACNPSYFPASFKTYEITALYKSDTVEKAIISGGTISPKSSMILDGVFSLNRDALAKFRNENTTFDPTYASIITKVSAPIFGVIPYSVNKEYSVQDFQRIVKEGPPGSYDCK